MKENIFRKGLVLAIIVFFVLAGVGPVISVKLKDVNDQISEKFPIESINMID